MASSIRHLLIWSAALWLLCAAADATAQVHTMYQLTDGSDEAGHASWSPDGTMIAYNVGVYGSRDIWIIPSAGGTPEQITTDPGNDDAPDWAPDGSAILFVSDRTGNDEVWVYNIGSETFEQFTFDPGSDWHPKWSPDGSEIVFCSDRSGSLDIWKMPATGGTPERLTTSSGTEWAPSWSPDGSQIVFVGYDSGNNDLWTIASDGTGLPSQVTTDAGHDLLASWSPDGSTLAFGSDRSGNLDIWTIPAIGGVASQLTTNSADEGNPDWSPDGSTIAFGSTRSGTSQIWIAVLEPFTRITEGPHVNDGGQSTAVCWIDYDQDGYLDLYVLNQSGNGISGQNFQYHNDGDGTYSSVTAGQLATDEDNSFSASWADYDNDGDVDVVVANFKGNSNKLYLNDGLGQFTAQTSSAISLDQAGSTSASWVDYDSDGLLDLLLANSSDDDLGGYVAYENFLYHHEGDEMVKVESGDIVTVSKHTYGVGWADFDSDGDPDLLNSNASNETLDLYRNDGGGTFTRLATEILGSDITNGGGVNWADYDNDSDFDLFIGGLTPGSSLLYENDGDGTFTKVVGHGLEIISGQASGGSWGDCDNDGDLDLFVFLDNYSDPVNALGYVFLNDGTGLFSQLPAVEFVCESCRTRSAVWGDHDRDGDLDLFAVRAMWEQDGADNLLYRNNGNGNHWITIKPVGVSSNRSAIGARVRLKATIDGEPVWQLRELRSQTGGQSQGPLECHFGLGDATMADSITIEWPNGLVDVLEDVLANQFLTVQEGISVDLDGDDLFGAADNCPSVYNPSQEDADLDGVGDACCCVDRVGDANGNGVDEPSIADIAIMIEAKFVAGTCEGVIGCVTEADINQSGSTEPTCDDITIADIAYLIDYLFVTGPTLSTLADCL